MKIYKLLESVESESDLRNLCQSNNIIKSLLEFNFSEKQIFDLPEGFPEGRSFYSETTLIQEFRRLRIFMFDSEYYGILKKWKKEQLFVDLCVGLTKEEAQVLICVKDRNLTTMFPNISKENWNLINS